MANRVPGEMLGIVHSAGQIFPHGMGRQVPAPRCARPVIGVVMAPGRQARCRRERTRFIVGPALVRRLRAAAVVNGALRRQLREIQAAQTHPHIRVAEARIGSLAVSRGLGRT